MGANDNLGHGTYTIDFITQMENTKGIAAEFEKSLSKIKMPMMNSEKLRADFASLYKEIDRITDIYNKKTKSKGDATGFERSAEKIGTLIDKIEQEYTKLSGKEIKFNVKEPTELIEARQHLKELQDQLKQGLNADSFNAIREALKGITSETSGKMAKELQEAFNSGSVEEFRSKFENLAKRMTSFKFDKDSLEQPIKNLSQAIISMDTQKLNEVQKDLNAINETDLDSSSQRMLRIAKAMLTIAQNGDKVEAMKAFDSLREQISGTEQKVVGLADKWKNDLVNGLNSGAEAWRKQTGAARESLKAVGDATTSQARMNSELDQLKSRITYFFGLTNAVHLFRRALRQTFNTVKELDESMTKTAVVTDFSVGDMWDQLPQYTKTAKEFGVTIKGVYDVMTLYYQQGLDQNTAWELGTETLKLARIAGLEYAEATDRRLKSYAA